LVKDSTFFSSRRLNADEYSRMRKMGKRFYLFSQAEFGVSELMYTIPSFIDNGKKKYFISVTVSQLGS
jgi:hypothetical protein